jgi:hypothetical protein
MKQRKADIARVHYLSILCRTVDEKDLIASAGSGLPLSSKGPSSERILADGDLSELFGLEMAAAGEKAAARTRPGGRRASASAKRKAGKKKRTRGQRERRT